LNGQQAVVNSFWLACIGSRPVQRIEGSVRLSVIIRKWKACSAEQGVVSKQLLAGSI
jgi:hypothetical protein